MEIIYLLVAVSIGLVVFIGWAFWWAAGAGQFDDLERAASEILREDDQP